MIKYVYKIVICVVRMFAFYLGLTLLIGSPIGFLAAHASFGGLAKQETGHPPVYSRPNDQAFITTATTDSIGT